MAGQQSSKGWMPDTRPARKHYWARRTLEKNKVRRLLKDRQRNGSPRFSGWKEALKYWRSVRTRMGRLG